MPRGSPDGSHLWCRLASWIDSDGSIGIQRGFKRLQRRWNPRYQADICVINTSEVLMEWLVSFFGGRITRRRQVREHHKPSYRWHIADRRAHDIMLNVRPYLIVKGKQADVLIEFVNLRDNVRVGRFTNPIEVERRERLYQRMRKLNATGVAPAETKREGASE